MSADRRGFVPQSQIDDANEDIVEVIGRYIKLKKAGKEYTGLCPFHDERSPSFSVSPKNGAYYCFGCSASGNAVSFVMNHLGISFRDAVETINGRLELESGAAPLKKVKRPQVIRCDLPGHVEDPQKAAAAIARAERRPTHSYLVRNGVACIGDCLVLKGALLVPLINYAGEIVNAAAIKDDAVTYAAGGPSYGSLARLEPSILGELFTPILCADYALAWRLWWQCKGRVLVLCAMSVENLRWTAANCRHLYGRIGCHESEREEWEELGHEVVTAFDRSQRCS